MAEKIEVVLEKKAEHKNIYAALSAFQGELKPMAKNGVVEFQTRAGATLKFNYTPLGDIMASIYPILAKHGLSIRHEVTEKGVEAILSHETYTEESVIGVETVEKKPHMEEVGLIDRSYTIRIKNEIRSGMVKISQGGEMKDTGAAITYARRYTLTMVLGISSEEDKDAELLEQTAKNAMMNVMQMASMKLENAKTEADIKKVKDGFEKDLKQIAGGKAPALGLSKEQYETLVAQADLRIKQIKEGVDTTIVKDEQ